MIKVVCAEIKQGAHARLLEKYLSDFPGVLRKKILGYRNWQDAQLSLLGIVIALDTINAVTDRSYTANDLEYTSSNKPIISNSNVHFNISHSGDLVVCAISTQGEVGIDIERMNSDLDFLSANMTVAERQKISGAADKKTAFYSYWTQKEAVLKASGVGLIDEFGEFEVEDNAAIFRGVHYRVKEVAVGHGYTCMVAIGSSAGVQDDPVVILERYEWSSEY